jgi:SPP1 family predicted phage head-tail adaptor
MRAGLLARARITISRATVTQNSYGEDVPVWTAIGSYWANIRALQGRELQALQQTWAEARFRIDMRYQRGTTFKRSDRVTWGDRTLDILDVEDPDQRQRRLFITCKEYAE